MIRDIPGGSKHVIDLVAFVGGPILAGISLANAAVFMSLLAAACSVLWFCVRMYDRIKYGPNVND
jgi:hypothetical protein